MRPRALESQSLTIKAFDIRTCYTKKYALDVCVINLNNYGTILIFSTLQLINRTIEVVGSNPDTVLCKENSLCNNHSKLI